MLKILQLLLITLIKLITRVEDSGDLILVHVVFRHGERTPVIFYPNDPYINETFYPIGLGELTERGKMTGFQLGKRLRQEYRDFLGNFYVNEETEVHSSNFTRTIMTAQLVMSGLWPSAEEPKVDSFPVMVEPIEKEILKPDKCARRNTILKELSTDKTIYETYLKPYESLVQYIEEHSGFPIRDIFGLMVFQDILDTEKKMGLELPEWANKIYPDPIRAAVARCFDFRTTGTELKRIHGGYLLEKWLNDTKEKISDTFKTKMFLYSAHDTTIGYLNSILNTTEPHLPQVGSAIVLELRRIDEKYFLKLRYIRNPWIGNIQDLRVPGCEVLCPLEMFEQLVGPVLPIVSFEEACKE